MTPPFTSWESPPDCRWWTSRLRSVWSAGLRSTLTLWRGAGWPVGRTPATPTLPPCLRLGESSPWWHSSSLSPRSWWGADQGFWTSSQPQSCRWQPCRAGPSWSWRAPWGCCRTPPPPSSSTSPPAWTTPCPRRRRQGRRPGRPWNISVQLFLNSKKFKAPVVSSCDAVKLLLASRVPQHQPHILSVHTKRGRSLEAWDTSEVLTISSSPRSPRRWSSCTLLWRFPCNTSGSWKTSQQLHFPRSPPTRMGFITV